MSFLPLIEGIVTDVLPPMFNRAATLHVSTAGAHVPGTGTTKTYVDHVLGKGCFLDSNQVGLRGVGLVELNEVAILFYTGRLPSGVKLKSDDEVTVKDKVNPLGKRYRLVRKASEDSAQATQIWAAVDV